jgi:flagellar biosynthetic protein FliP
MVEGIENEGGKWKGKMEGRNFQFPISNLQSPISIFHFPFSKFHLPLVCLVVLMLLATAGCSAKVGPVGTTGSPVTLEIGDAATPQGTVGALQVLLLLTVLTLAPAVLILMTAFTRIVIVLSVARSAIGIPQVPPNQVVVGLALFLTFFVMAPVWSAVNQEAVQPYLAGEIDQTTALEQTEAPLRAFMLRQTREEDLALFVSLAQMDRPRTPDDVPSYVLIPSFVISELRTAFQMAFVIYVPFLVIDMVVSTTMLAMGMLMLPPTLISLPFKLLLFVMVDGWHLLTRSLVLSFH